MYTIDDQQYACSTGCKTPTIDSTFPNRGHLYAKTNQTPEVEILLPPIDNTLSYFFNSFFSLNSGMEFSDLTEHAQSMELLVVPYLRSDVTILTNDVSEMIKCCSIAIAPPPPKKKGKKEKSPSLYHKLI